MSVATGGARQAGWYHGWNIVGATVLAQIAANALPISAFSLFLVPWSRDFDANISTLQLGIATTGLGSALLAPAVGLLVDKYPARGLLATGLSALALFCILLSFATQTWQYMALYACLSPFALCFATSLPANSVISRWFVRRRGLALGISAFGLGLGGVVMPPLVAELMPLFGWRTLWFWGGVIVAIVILPLVILVIRDRPGVADGHTYLTADGFSSSTSLSVHAVTEEVSLGWGGVAKRRNFWLLLIAYLPMLAVYGGCMQNLAPIAMSRGIAQSTAGLMISVLSFSQVIATLVVGGLSDRFGNGRPLAVLALLAASGGLVIASAQNTGLFAFAAMLAGVGGAFWPVLAGAVAREFGTLNFGRAFGLLTLFLPLSIIAPVGVAMAQEKLGSYTPALLTLAVAAAIGGIAALMLHERHVAVPVEF